VHIVQFSISSQLFFFAISQNMLARLLECTFGQPVSFNAGESFVASGQWHRCRCWKRCLCRLNFHHPARVDIAIRNDFHHNIMQKALLESRHTHLSRNSKWDCRWSVRVTPVRLAAFSQSPLFYYARLTKQWAHVALLTHTQFGQLYVNQYLQRYL